MGLGENVVLRLVDCLTPTVSFDVFMDNYFTYFCLLIHLGVIIIQATGVLNKNRLRKYTNGQTAPRKRNAATLNGAAYLQKAV